ncbi:MAG: tetratricopeptide repeat protein [Myxococcota bacterium]
MRLNSRETSRWFTLFRRVCACLLVAALWAAPSSSAYAQDDMDKQKIVNMSKMGLGANAIKGAIGSTSPDDFQLTPEDLGELRIQGVDEEVITYLKDNGYVEGEKETAEKDEPADEGEQTAPADEGDSGAGPAPAPAPGEEGEEGETLSEEELEQRVEEKIQERDRQQQQAQERERKLEAAARKLPQAKRALGDGNNMQAAKQYLEYLSLNPPQNSDNWYEAKFGLAKALYKQGILSGAATPLLEVLLAGAERPHFKEGFYMLEKLTARIGYQPPILEEMTKTYIGDFNDDFKNDFHYYLGKFFYDYGNADNAIEYLGKVTEGAPDYPEARYLMGVARLDKAAAGGQEQAITGDALRNFEEAILAGEDEPGGNEEILQLGYLALARSFYEAGIYDVALYYYQKIPNQSARNAEAEFETAWAYFVKNDFKRALGQFHTLHSPYYEKWYFPDLYILESAVYLNLCKYEKSKEALASFQDKFLDKQPRLQTFLAETTEPKAYWDAISVAFENQNSQEGLPVMFANAVLDDLAYYNTYKVINVLQQERDQLQGNIGALGEFGEEVLKRVEEQLDTKTQEGGILVQRRLNEINEELLNYDAQATKISFDIDKEESERLREQLQNRETDETGPEKGTTLLIVSDDFTPWPFEGEYWLDEVTNYRSRLRSECVEQ